MRFTNTTTRQLAKSLMFILLSGWTFFAIAQPANNSPYARYGLGNLNTGVNVRSAGVGGLSIAMREDSIPYLVNFANPASYTSVGFTAFDIGIYGNIATISTSTESQQVNKANLSYFAFGFPILKVRVKNKADSLIEIDEETGFRKIRKRILWGGSFGLREFSSVNYSATQSILDETGTFGGDSAFNYSYLFEGDGGVNQAFIGIGLEPIKNFSIGANVSYLFGRLNRIQRLEFDETNYFNVKKERYTDVGGFYVDYGLQYAQPIKNHVLLFGATFAHPMKVRANSTLLAQTYKLSAFGEDIFRDTVAYDVVKGGHITMPWKYGFGVTWKGGENWLVGVEHAQSLWSTYKNVNGKNDSLVDAWSTRVGLEYKPMVPPTSRGIWAYFGKMHYRLGGHYGMTQFQINGTQLPNYGITLGFGFPLRRTRAGSGKYVQSMINFAVEWGQRGTTDSSLLLEDYWNFKLGFTLNDRWFIKRKYD